MVVVWLLLWSSLAEPPCGYQCKTISLSNPTNYLKNGIRCTYRFFASIEILPLRLHFFLLVGLWLEVEKITKEGKMGLDAHKCFIEMDEYHDMRDGVQVEMVD